MGKVETTYSPTERWKSQSHHGKVQSTWSKHKKVEAKESTWEGGNDRVTTGRWKLHIDHRKVETTESTWEDVNQRVVMESPWEGGNHRVNMGRWKPPQTHQRKVETTESTWKDRNHKGDHGKVETMESLQEKEETTDAAKESP